MKSPIFYNNDIKVGGQFIYYNEWYKRGVRYINDLVKNNGDFYSPEEFSKIAGIQIDYLQYYGTIQAITSYVKKANITLTHKEQNPFIPSNILPLMQNKKGAQVMYNILNKNKETPTAKQTWNRTYNFKDEDWKEIFMHPFITTKYSVLRWFQICINHNVLVTNKLLHHMKIKNNSVCTFCKLEDETISHLLWKCNKTQEFIKAVTTWLQKFNIHCYLSEESFLFGLEKTQKLSKMLKFILLYTKYYIYCSRCKKQSLLLGVFKRKLLFMYKIHMDIAFSNNELENFHKEWRPYENLIQDIQQ